MIGNKNICYDTLQNRHVMIMEFTMMLAIIFVTDRLCLFVKKTELQLKVCFNNIFNLIGIIFRIKLAYKLRKLKRSGYNYPIRRQIEY